MNQLQKGASVLMAALSLILALVIAGGFTGCTPEQVAQPGKPAPDFELQSIEGQSVSLGDLRGRPVLVNFWASWCGPCLLEMPFLHMTHEQWAEKGLVMLAINIGESPSEVKEFVESRGLTFTVLLDTKQEVAQIYNIRGIPATFFIDKSGIIQDIKMGAFTSKAEIERLLSKIIPELT